MPELAACAGAIAVLLAPGLLVEALLPRRGDLFVRLAMAIGYGLAFWPLLFLWTSSAGLRWTPAAARVVVAMLAIACVIVIRRRAPFRLRDVRWTLLTAALFALAIVTRITQIRGVVLPLWVDSVHHTMIARLLIDHGSLPASYAPFIADSSFYYHWGFHAVVAFVAWVTGMTSPIDVARLLLWFGQMLNALTFVSMYAAGRALFSMRAAWMTAAIAALMPFLSFYAQETRMYSLMVLLSMAAAVFATLVSYFPAYYVSWGRYTHLCGLLLLAPIGIALARAARRPSIANGLGLVILSAGLIVIHVRIAFFAATFAVVLAIALVVARRARGIAIWIAAAVAAIVLVSPWLVRLTGNENVRRVLAPAAAEKGQWETSNGVQDDLLWAPNNVPLMIAATGGLFGLTRIAPMALGWRLAAFAWWGALVFAVRQRTSRIAAPYLLVAGWTALTALLVNASRFGLPPLRAVPNSAAIITLFVPLSLAAAGLVAWFVARVTPRHASLVTAIVAVAIALIGASTMWTVINPRTLLAREADLRALAWIRERTPRDAKFAVGVQPWMAGSFVGIDGGYWIPVLTDRASLLPPGLYTWAEPAAQTARVNEILAEWSAAPAPTPALLDLLRREHVTDVYFGPAGSSPMRALLVETGAGTVVYDDGGVTIVHLRP